MIAEIATGDIIMTEGMTNQSIPQRSSLAPVLNRSQFRVQTTTEMEHGT